MRLNLKRQQCRLQQLLGNMRCPCGIRFRQYKNEFIATETRHCVLLPHGAFKPPRQNDQQFVAHPVSERVVDMLEMIQIQKHQRQGRAIALRGVQCHVTAIG